MPEAAKEQSSDPRPSTVVVTSENLAEFHAQKLGIEPPPKPGESKSAEAPKGEPGAKGDQANAAEEVLEEERKAEKDPKKQRLNMRFSELTAERNTARNERDAAKSEAQREREARLAAEAKLNERKPEGEAKGDKAKGQPPADAEKPDRSKFKAGTDGDAEYQDAVIDWRADQRIRQREGDAAEARAQEAHEVTLRTWKENQQAIRAVIPDYDAKIAASTVQLSNEVRDTIITMEGENGPRCLYYFAEFPQEAERIGKLTVGRALLELGKIEAKVASGKKPDEKGDKPNGEAKGDAEVSKAPKPAVPLKASSAPEDVVDDQGNLKPDLSFKDYKAARKAGKIR